MARPIKYIPQVIPTDFGNLAIQAMQNRQNQYDAAFSGAMQAEDQFGQLVVDPSDIEGKNTILGGFKDRTKQIVDKYGGDYGAAAKELASEITKTRANPFFQVAEFKRTMAEEERRKKESLGTNAIVVKSISNTPVLGADGRVVSKDQLESKIYDKRQLMQDLAIKYGNIANQQRDESVEYKIPGYATKVIRTGLLPEEVAPKIEEAVSQLRASYGDIPEETLRQIASEYIPSLVGGRKTQELADNRLSMEGQSIQNKIGRLTLQMKQKELANINLYGNANGPVPEKDYSKIFTPGADEVTRQTPAFKESVAKFNEAGKGFSKAVKDIDEYKKDIADSQKRIKALGDLPEAISQKRLLEQSIKEKNKLLNDARLRYIRFEKAIGKEAIDSYISKGLTKVQAINAIGRNLQNTDIGLNTVQWDSRISPNKAVNSLAEYTGEFYTVDENGNEIKSKGNLLGNLKGKNLQTVDVGFDMPTSSIVYKVIHGDKTKDVKLVYVPLESNDANLTAKHTATSFNNIKKAYSGLAGVGYFTINPKDGSLERHATKANIPDGTQIVDVSFDKNTGTINSTIKTKVGNVLTTSRRSGQPNTMRNVSLDFADMFGQAFGAEEVNQPKATTDSENY